MIILTAVLLLLALDANANPSTTTNALPKATNKAIDATSSSSNIVLRGNTFQSTQTSTSSNAGLLRVSTSSSSTTEKSTTSLFLSSSETNTAENSLHTFSYSNTRDSTSTTEAIISSLSFSQGSSGEPANARQTQTVTSCASGDGSLNNDPLLPTCGQHGVCEDTLSDFTGQAIAKCRCDTGWIGYDCSVDASTVFDHCFNGMLDTDKGETDVDCGGNRCDACGEGSTCASSRDCSGSGSSSSSSSSNTSSGAGAGASETTLNNRTLICSGGITLPHICVYPTPKPQGNYLVATLRLAGVAIASLKRPRVANALHEATLVAITGYINATRNDTIRAKLSFTRMHPYGYYSGAAQRRRFMTTTTVDVGVEVTLEYQLSPSENEEPTAVVQRFNESVTSAAYLKMIVQQAPGFPVTSTRFSAPSAGSSGNNNLAVIQMAQRPSPQPIEIDNGNNNNNDQSLIFSTVGGIVAAVATALVLVPLAGIGAMAFLGERDANGHTWADRSVIHYCPCCARSLYRNPVTASAPHGTGLKKRTKGRSVVVQNPALDLIGQKIDMNSGAQPVTGGPVSGKEFLAQKRAARAAAAAAARPRSSSKSRNGTPASSGSIAVTSPISGGVKRIGGSQPHGVLLDTVKPTVANVVEMMRDTATLGVEMGSAYEHGMKLPSPAYTAPTGNGSGNRRRSSSGFKGNNNNNNSNNMTSSVAIIDDEQDVDVDASRNKVARIHRPSITAAAQRIAFSPDQSRRDGPNSHSSDADAIAPASPVTNNRNSRGNGGPPASPMPRTGLNMSQLLPPPSPGANTPLLSNNNSNNNNGMMMMTQGNTSRASSAGIAFTTTSSSLPPPPPLPPAVPLGIRAGLVSNNGSNSQLTTGSLTPSESWSGSNSYTEPSSGSVLNGGGDGGGMNSGYLPPPPPLPPSGGGSGGLASQRGAIKSFR